MSSKILRRCTVCGNFHASYLVENPGQEKRYLCYTCWKAGQTPKPAQDTKPGAERPDVVMETLEDSSEERVCVGKMT